MQTGSEASQHEVFEFSDDKINSQSDTALSRVKYYWNRAVFSETLNSGPLYLKSLDSAFKDFIPLWSDDITLFSTPFAHS